MHLVGRVKPDKIVDNAICFWCGRKIVWLKFLVLKVFLNLSLSIARKKIEFLVNLSGISTEIHENASNGRLKSKGCDRLENFEAKSLEYQTVATYFYSGYCEHYLAQFVTTIWLCWHHLKHFFAENKFGTKHQRHL